MLRKREQQKHFGISLNSQQIRRLLELGREEDVNRGGYRNVFVVLVF
jgi:hypothetical protein